MFIGYDIETEGDEELYALQPWRVLEGTARVTLSCAWYNDTPVVETSGFIDALTALRAAGKPVALWKGTFDLAFLYASGIDISGISWIDGICLWKFLVNGQNMPYSWSLKEGAKTFLNNWAKQEEFLAMKDEELPDSSDPYWLRRVSMDAEATALIADVIWPLLTPQQQNLAKIQSISLPMMAKSWVNGIRLDLDAVKAAKPIVIQKMLLQEAKLNLLEPGSCETNYTPSKILRSPIKMKKLLYEDWGLPCTRYTEKGAKSTDKAALTYLADADTRVQEIIIWRAQNTILSKFTASPLEACEYLGSTTTHAEPKVFATYTKRGSFSSKVRNKKVGIALHQLPRGKEIRSYVLPTRPGEYVVEFDVMAQEARWMAVMANDQVMIDLFNSATPDIHSYMGSRLENIPFEEFLERKKAHDPEIVGAHGWRNLGKFINLSYNYRISPATARIKARVDYDLNVEVAQTALWKNIFLQAYVGIPQYWKTAPKIAKAKGYAETLAGARYAISLWGSLDWKCSSSAINFPIQGISSDQKELAMAVVVTTTPSVEDRLMLEMHDALHFSFPGNWTIGYLQNINRILNEIDYKKFWGVDLPVGFPWEGTLGPNEGNKISFGAEANPKLTIDEFYQNNKEAV